MSDKTILAGVEVADERIFAFRLDDETYRIARNSDNKILVEKEGKPIDAGKVSPDILKYVQATITPVAQEFIESIAKKFDRRKIYEAISKLAINFNETEVYGANYGIRCERNGNKIKVVSVFKASRMHVATRDTGAGVEMLAAFTDAEEADKFLLTFKIRYNKRFELRAAIHEFEEEYDLTNPQPRLPKIPNRPPLEKGQSKSDYIQNILTPWRENANRISQSNNKKADDWQQKLNAARSAWIKKNLDKEMKEFHFTEGDLVMSYSVLLHETKFYVANVPFLG